MSVSAAAAANRKKGLPMSRYALTFVTTLLAFAMMDSVWLTFVAGPMYHATIGPILLNGFRIVPAIVFYLIQITGMMVFVVPKIQGGQTVAQNALFGALFGLFTYCCFDLTALSIVALWTTYLAVVDIAWGCVLSGMASVIGIGIADLVLRPRTRAA